MCVRISILLLIIFLSGTLSAQDSAGKTGPDLRGTLDKGNWKKTDLKNLTIRLPGEFEYVQRQCIHYQCDIFSFRETRIVVTYGDIPYATDRQRAKPDYKEATVKINELVALIFQYSDGGEFSYIATFPSDLLGAPLVNLEFRSRDSELSEFAESVLRTIVFKTKLNGKQKYFIPKECRPPTEPARQPFEFEEIKAKLQLSATETLAKEIESRRFFFDFTAERQAELVRVGAATAVIAVMRKVEAEVREQTNVYERFVAGYNSQDIAKLKDSLSAGQEFLDRWGCDPMWHEQIKFIRPWIRRL